MDDPFKAVDFSDLPLVSRYTARDGANLAYRNYLPAAGTAPGKGSIVLVHGSAASSSGMHPLAKALAAAGYRVCALDVRGHGDSGPRGQINYLGQLEDDLTDFMQTVAPAPPVTLAGFSSGGGFALRVAGSDRQSLFQSYLLLSPFLSQDAPTARPSRISVWASVGLPRILTLAMLNRIGIHAFDGLPAVRFALDEKAKATLTPEYSYALLINFGPQRDYLANLRAVHAPCAVVVGADDELFYPDRFADVFRQAGANIPVTIVPGAGHLQITLAPQALVAAVQAADRLRR